MVETTNRVVGWEGERHLGGKWLNTYWGTKKKKKKKKQGEKKIEQRGNHGGKKKKKKSF